MSSYEEPPSNQTNMDSSARILSTNGALARRFEDIGTLWRSSWGIPTNRDVIHGRCYPILIGVQGRQINEMD